MNISTYEHWSEIRNPMFCGAQNSGCFEILRWKYRKNLSERQNKNEVKDDRNQKSIPGNDQEFTGN